MTLEELESKIVFKEQTVEGVTTLKATLELSVEQKFHKDDLAARYATNILEEQVKPRMIAEIIHTLYEDQTRTMFDSCKRLHAANPFDHGEVNNAIQDILSAARFQPPNAESPKPRMMY